MTEPQSLWVSAPEEGATKRKVRLGALAVTALSLVATPLQAHAVLPGASVGSAVFSGKMQVGVPICDDISSLAVVCGLKKGVVQPFVLDAGPNVCCANGTPSACAGAVVHPKKNSVARISLPPLNHCDITAAGFVFPSAGLGPWCGGLLGNWWSGAGIGGTIEYNKGKIYSFAGGFWPMSIGTIAVILAVGPGGKAKGLSTMTMVTILDIRPDFLFKAQSCRQFLPPSPGATDFLVTGATVFVAV